MGKPKGRKSIRHCTRAASLVSSSSLSFVSARVMTPCYARILDQVSAGGAFVFVFLFAPVL